MTRATWLAFAVTSGLLAGTFVLEKMGDRAVPVLLAVPLDGLDSQIAGWAEVDQSRLDPESLKTLNPTSYLLRTYRKNKLEANLFIAYYAYQRAGESVHSPRHCLPGASWEFSQRGSTTVSVGGKQITINKVRVEHLGSSVQMLYWYQSQTRIVADEYVAKVMLARDTLLTGRNAGALVRILLPDDNLAEAEGIGFVSLVIPRIQICLGVP